MSAGPPTTLGKYQIIREIARSNDIVYEAYDPAMNRRVAIKELNFPGGGSAQRDERIRRFQREIKAAGSLTHPGIVTIYEMGEDDGRHYMAMEYLDGKTLRNELDTSGLLPPGRALEVTIAVLEALEFAHNNGVIHRDIKPENIQMLSNGRIKLTDFGIARLTFEPNITIDGQVFGTPSYMSPEQVVGKEIDARSDLFSVGSVLFEMLAGQKAFPGDSVVSISYAIMNTEPTMPPSANFTLQQLIRSLIDKTVSMRYPNAAAALKAARDAQEQMKSGQTVLSSHPTGGFAPYPPPVVAQPPQQPYSYGYNPPPQSPMGVPIPIYLPPPPRPPLFKPETKQAIGRFFVTVISLSLVLALIIVGVQSMAGAAGRIGQQSSGRAATVQPGSEAERSNAIQWASTAQRQSQMGDYRSAIQSLGYAMQSDPAQPNYPAQLGEVYANLAERAPVEDEAISAWQASGKNWEAAANLLISDPTRASRFRESSASAHYNAAVLLINRSDRRAGRLELMEAYRLAPQRTTIKDAVERLLDTMS